MVRPTVARVLVVLFLASTLVAGCSSSDGDSADSGADDSALPPQEGLEIGDKAPDFRLKNQDQETVVLSEQLSQGNVILVFYPMAFTPV